MSSVRRISRSLWEFLYGVYVVVTFVILSLLCLGTILLPFSLNARRSVTHGFARAVLIVIGARARVHHRERLPAGACVVVANHASYLDGIVLKAMLPAHFSFVIKKEMSSVPLGGLLLRRIGSQFVERTNRQTAAADARRMMKLADAGQALVFFAEGTFNAEPGIARFHSGAFVIASRAKLPVVPVALRGTREMFPDGKFLVRPGRINVLVQEPIAFDPAAPDSVARVRDAARSSIIAATGEPDLANAPV